VEFLARRTLPEPKSGPPALASYRPWSDAGRFSATLKATGEVEADGAAVFALDAPLGGSGRFEGELRVHPSHQLLTHPNEMGLMKWLG
jgi:hypothetical protein